MTHPARRPVWDVFSHRNYTLFMLGLGPAAISSWMQRVGIGWLAWELTHSPVWLGVIAAADLVPILLLSPMAGVYTDRSSPMKILLVTQWLQFVQAALLAGFMLAGFLNIELLFGLTLALGFIHAFSTAARHAVVPNTVPKALVGTAVSLDSALFQASRFIGPAIAAIIIPIWGVLGTFMAHALGTFLFSIVMHFMHMPVLVRAKHQRKLWTDIADSVHYIRAHEGILPLFLMLAAASICLRPIQDMLPGFAEAVFNSDAVGLAWLTSAMGAGAMISAMRVALLGNLTGLANLAFAGLIGVSLATFGLVATRELMVGIVFAAISGYTFNTLSVSIQALVQSALDDSMRSRVMSFYTVIYRGTPALGALFFGFIAEFVGLRWSYALAAAIGIATAALLFGKRRAIRRTLERE